MAERLMNNILIFAFKNNISEDILNGIDIPNKHLLSTKSEVKFQQDFDELPNLIRTGKFEHIIGLGQYTGKDKDKIRIEQIASNHFRNNRIGQSEYLEIPSALKNSNFDPEYFKLARGLGNSWCNLVSYKIVESIKHNDLKVTYDFLHTPKIFDKTIATSAINNLILDI